MNTPNDQVDFMRSGQKTPAIYKMPPCESQVKGSGAPFIGDYYVTDGSFLTIEACPGQILTIQSSFKDPSAYDENSWTAFFVRNALKISMTMGLVGTGIYQYFRIKK